MHGFIIESLIGNAGLQSWSLGGEAHLFKFLGASAGVTVHTWGTLVAT